MHVLQSNQSLLLQAAFGDGPQAEVAWRRWLASAPLDDIDGASTRALPQLHLNIAAIAASDARVQGLYRRAWYANSLLLDKVQPLLKRLAADSIRVVAGKQTAAVLKVRACYPLERFHLLVPASEVSRTSQRLRELGWTSSQPAKSAWAASHGIDFRADKFLVQLCCEAAGDSGFWDRLEPLECDKGMFEVPGQVDQLVEAAAPRYSWHVTSMYQRVFETLIAIRYGADRPDWETIAAVAATTGVTLALADTLHYLDRDFGALVPAGYVDGLRAAGTLSAQCAEYRLKCETPSPWQRLRLARFEYRNLRALAGAQGERLTLREYLRLRWNVRGFRSVLGRLAALATHKDQER